MAAPVMFDTLATSSSVCLVEGASGLAHIRVCLQYVLVPSAFLVYILAWYLVAIGILTAGFWNRFGRLFIGCFTSVATFIGFFLRCVGIRGGKRSTADGAEKEGLLLDVDEAAAESTAAEESPASLTPNADFIDPTCGNCNECLSNPGCPMKLWRELNRLLLWCKPFSFMAVPIGLLALAVDLLVIALPSNQSPHEDKNDKVLNSLLSFAPAWAFTINLMIQAVVSVFIVLLIRMRKSSVPANRGVRFRTT